MRSSALSIASAAWAARRGPVFHRFEPEDGHDAVGGELLDAAAEALELRDELFQRRRKLERPSPPRDRPARRTRMVIQSPLPAQRDDARSAGRRHDLCLADRRGLPTGAGSSLAAGAAAGPGSAHRTVAAKAKLLDASRARCSA